MKISDIFDILAVINFGISTILSVLGVISSNGMFVGIGITTLVCGWILAYIGDKFNSQKTEL